MKKAIWYLVILAAFTAIVSLLVNEFLAPQWTVPAGLLVGHVSGIAASSILKGHRGQGSLRDWDKDFGERRVR